MLENFPPYLAMEAELHPESILDELQKREFYNKPQGKQPYSTDVKRYSLMLRYTSPQCYRLLQDKFPLPSFRLFRKLHEGGVSSLTAAKQLLEAGSI